MSEETLSELVKNHFNAHKLRQQRNKKIEELAIPLFILIKEKHRSLYSKNGIPPKEFSYDVTSEDPDVVERVITEIMENGWSSCTIVVKIINDDNGKPKTVKTLNVIL